MGDEEHVRELFAGHPVAFTFERPTSTVEFPSADAFEAFVLMNSGPLPGDVGVPARHRYEGHAVEAGPTRSER